MPDESAAADDGGAREPIFGGLKFFFVRQIPKRKDLIADFKAHGGEEVFLEKHADIIIADRARKDAPKGSTSWHYVDECLAQGRLLDTSAFAAGPGAGVSRGVGVSAPRKNARTKFTAEEDKLLEEYCRQSAQRGGALKGNKIYEAFAREHPTHTAQSWRDRATKRFDLDRMIQDEMGDRMPSTPARANPRSPLAHRVKSTPGTPKKRSLPAGGPSTPQQGSEAADANEERGSGLFTDADTKLLTDSYDEIEGVDISQAGAAWRAFATEHNQHTATQWERYWREYVRPKGKPRASKQPIVTTPSKEKKSSTPKKKARKLSPAARPDVRATPGKHSRPPASSIPETPTRKVMESVEDETSGIDPEREQFVNEAVEFYARTDIDFVRDVDFVRYPTITGLTVDMAALWEAVNAQFGGYAEVESENLWSEIATSAGLAGAGLEIRNLCQCLDDYDQYKAEQQNEADLAQHAAEANGCAAEPEPSQRHTPRDESWRKRTHDALNVTEVSGGAASKRPRADVASTKSNGWPAAVVPAEDAEVSWHSSLYEATPPPPKTKRIAEPETQDFGFTQGPAGSQRDPFLSPAALSDTESPPAETESQTREELQRFIERYISLGYAEDVVLQALRATTMTTGNAGVVMESLARGDGIPDDIPGVWTADEDEAVMRALNGVESSDFYWTFDKHGEDAVRKRQQYLRDTGDDGS